MGGYAKGENIWPLAESYIPSEMHHTEVVVGHGNSHPVVRYVVAVGRYVHDAGKVGGEVGPVIVLDDGAWQAGELIPNWLSHCQAKSV